MLVLTRKLNERIVIDGKIVVTVVGINKNAIRIGIDAPNDVPIHRQEVHDLIQQGGRDVA